MNDPRPIPSPEDLALYAMQALSADEMAAVPAGTFLPNSEGYASLVLPSLPSGVQAKAFGITIENAAGSATPTMPIVLSGAAGD